MAGAKGWLVGSKICEGSSKQTIRLNSLNGTSLMSDDGFPGKIPTELPSGRIQREPCRILLGNDTKEKQQGSHRGDDESPADHLRPIVGPNHGGFHTFVWLRWNHLLHGAYVRAKRPVSLHPPTREVQGAERWPRAERHPTRCPPLLFGLPPPSFQTSSSHVKTFSPRASKPW